MTLSETELAGFYRLNETLIAAGQRGEDALDGIPFEEVEPPTEWRVCTRIRVTPELHHMFSVATGYAGHSFTVDGGPDLEIAHPIILFHLGSLPALKVFPVLITAGEASRQAKMDARFIRPVIVGTEYTEWCRLAGKYVRRGNRYLVTEGRFLDPEEREVQSYRLTRVIGRDA